jgi:hypothetical protein
MPLPRRAVVSLGITCILLLTGSLRAQRVLDVQAKETEEPAAAIHVVDVLWGPAFSGEELDSLAPGSQDCDFARYRVVSSEVQCYPYFYIDLTVFEDMGARILWTYEIPLGFDSDLVGSVELLGWQTPDSFAFRVSRGDYAGDFRLCIYDKGDFEITALEDDGPP